MISKSKVNSVASSVGTSSQKVKEVINSIQNSASKSGNWWEGDAYNGFLDKCQKIETIHKQLQSETNILKSQLTSLASAVATEELKRQQAKQKQGG